MSRDYDAMKLHFDYGYDLDDTIDIEGIYTESDDDNEPDETDYNDDIIEKLQQIKKLIFNVLRLQHR